VWCLEHVPPGRFVVADFFVHPVFRRDSFFRVVTDITGVADRDGLEEFMPHLAPSAYAEHFRQSGYENELEARPPAMIVATARYTKAQVQALDSFLSRHADSYRLQEIPGTRTPVLVRQAESWATEKSSEP
jgi:hypothetical protein